MDKNIIKGNAKMVKGKITETIGKVVGSEKLQLEGNADQILGLAQSKVGEIKDAISTEAKEIDAEITLQNKKDRELQAADHIHRISKEIKA